MDGADEKEEAFSVWAIPPPEVAARLKLLMASLRSEFGGPAFDPHITVVGAITLTPSEALRRFRSSFEGRRLKPYTARVSSVVRGTFLYQCVYLLIDPTPEVVEARAHCCNHLGYNSSTTYMPHLSLLYADLSEEDKEKAREKVKVLDEGILDLSFEVAELALYKTDTEDKTLESWEKVAVCSLKSDS